MTLKVGDTLWYVESDARAYPIEQRGISLTVIAVGRKWATLQRGYPRIDLKTLWADGGQYSSPGRCYPSQDAYLASLRRNKVWRVFWSAVYNHKAPDVSEEAIRQAAAALNISLEDKP